MAIGNSSTFDGLKFNLDDKDKVAAKAALDNHPEKLLYLTGATLKASGTGNNTLTFTQEANTVITDIYIHCVTAPTLGSAGDIGFDVGTSAAGGQIVAASSDTILDGGTTVTVGKVKKLALVNNDDSAAKTDLSAAVSATALDTSRTIHLTLSNTVAVDGTAVGSFTWIVKTMKVGVTSSTKNEGNVSVTALQ